MKKNENGNIEIIDNKLIKFSNLYGVKIEELLNGSFDCEELNKIKDKLSDLSKHDMEEVIKLIKFKRNDYKN